MSKTVKELKKEIESLKHQLDNKGFKNYQLVIDIDSIRKESIINSFLKNNDSFTGSKLPEDDVIMTLSKSDYNNLNKTKKEVKPILRDGYKFNYLEKKKLSNFFKSSNVKIALNILKSSINEMKNVPVQNNQVKTKLSNYELIKSMIEVIQKKVSKDNGYFKVFESLLNQKSFDLINNFQTKIYKK